MRSWLVRGLLLILAGAPCSAAPLFPGAQYAVGSRPQAVVVGDANGDGHPDVIAVNRMSADISVLLGDGEGGLTSAGGPAVGGFPGLLSAGDLDGNGTLDLVVPNTSSQIAILLGEGDGTLSAGSPLDFSASSNVEIADFDGDRRPDGHLDLAIASVYSEYVSVYRGRGDGTFMPELRFGVGGFPTWIIAADFDGNGRPDLATANTGTDDVSILLSQRSTGLGGPAER